MYDIDLINVVTIYTRVSMEVSNWLVSWFTTCNLLTGLTTYLYGGYNQCTNYHGRPSRYSLEHIGTKAVILTVSISS